jgi:hypothetical protein
MSCPLPEQRPSEGFKRPGFERILFESLSLERSPPTINTATNCGHDFSIRSWNQLHVVTLRLQCTAQEVGARAGLKTDQRGLQVSL